MKTKILNTIKLSAPIKKPTMIIVVSAILFSLRLVLGRLSIDVGPMRLSITWIVLYLAGFLLGPIYGFAFGIITDTFNFFIFDQYKVWLIYYAMQEPLIAMFSGLLYIIYKRIKSDRLFLITYIVLAVSFVSTLITIMSINFNYSSGPVQDSGTSYDWMESSTIKIVSYILIIMGLLFSIWNIIVKYRKKKDIKIFVATSIAIIIPYAIFSIMFGAVFSKLWIEKVLGSQVRSDWLVAYTLIRVLKAMFMVPVQIAITVPLIKTIVHYSKTSSIFQISY